MTDKVKRFIAIPLVAITILGCTVSPATVSIAHADPKPWQYVPDDDDCKEPQSTPSDSTNENQEGVGGGDWLKEGTESNKVMKQMFKILTEEYGMSGAAACGILGFISGESGFRPTAAESKTGAQIDFGVNSKTPPAGFYYEDAGGGGGLFQFTPYTKYTEISGFWDKPNNANGGGWYVENEIACAWNEAFVPASYWEDFAATAVKYSATLYNGKMPKLMTSEAFLSTDDAGEAANSWGLIYERGVFGHERSERAIAINAYLNKDNIKADKSKWEAKGWHKGKGSLLNVASGVTAENDANNKKKCKEVQKGDIEKGSYLDVAKQIAANKFVGYYYGGGHAGVDKWSQPTESGDDSTTGLDCSGFVTQCFKHSSNSNLNKIDECLSAGIGSYDGYLIKKFTFTKHKFKSKDDLKAGDILLRDQEHTEIVLGWYDLNDLDADGNPKKAEEGKGTLLVIGAHNNQDGVTGDGGQKGDKEWYTPYEKGGEVSAMPYYDGSGWDYYYRPSDDLLKSDENNEGKTDSILETQKAQTNKKAKHEPKMV